MANTPIILQIENDEIDLEERGVETTLCTFDLLQELVAIKDKLPEFPSKNKGERSYIWIYGLAHYRGRVNIPDCSVVSRGFESQQNSISVCARASVPD